MKNAPDNAFLEEGAKKLMNYYGVLPFENAYDAAEATWESLLKVTGFPPDSWHDVEEWLMHPQLQANIAYYRAMGPWRIKQGLSPVPADLPEMSIPLAKLEPELDHSVVGLSAGVAFDEPRPLPNIIFLPEECFEAMPVFWLQEPVLTELLQLAKEVASDQYNAKALNRLDDRLAEIVKALPLKMNGIVQADVRVSGVRNHSGPARQIVYSWMNAVRHRSGFKDLRIFFKFD